MEGLNESESVSFASQSSVPKAEEEAVVRPSVDYHPSVWGDFFIAYSSSPSTDQKIGTGIAERVDELKEEVEAILDGEAEDAVKQLSLIDELQRLGVAYHYEDKIERALNAIHKDGDHDNGTLQTVALRFRLLRQNGCTISSDVFDKFMDGEGQLKAELSSDAKGLLCLYEATWLATRNEEKLDKAMSFARGHMENRMDCGDDVLVDQMRHTLETPFHRGMRRLEARHYISLYQDDENHNPAVLELAIMDFNLLQSLHQAEVRDVSVWWKQLDLMAKLGFARDRMVECYFWSLGVYFEPQYSEVRVLIAKLISLSSVMDDMFDAYGTLDELQLFTNVIHRWDLQDVDRLPDYMKIYLNSFSSLIKEIGQRLISKGRSHYMNYLIKAIKAYVGSYFDEAKWANSGYMPTLEEYLNISAISSGYPMLTCASLILMGEEVTEEVLDWVLGVPKIMEASALIARLMDDLVSTKLEQDRTHVSSSVQCYMREHGVSEQEACMKLREMVVGAWKDINNECLNPSPFIKNLLMIALNFARMIEVIYKHEDGYTNPAGDVKDHIAQLLVHPIKVKK